MLEMAGAVNREAEARIVRRVTEDEDDVLASSAEPIDPCRINRPPTPRRWGSGSTAIGAKATADTGSPLVSINTRLKRMCPTMRASTSATNEASTAPSYVKLV